MFLELLLPGDGCETKGDSGQEKNVQVDNLSKAELLGDAISSEAEFNIQDIKEVQGATKAKTHQNQAVK